MIKIIGREEARGVGLRTFVGSPCSHGHDGTRYTNDGSCRQCNINRSTIRQKRLQAIPEDAAKRRAYRAEWLLKNPNYRKEYHQKNRDRHREQARIRNARKRQPQIFNCLACGEPNHHHKAKYCSKRCGARAHREMRKLDPAALDQHHRQCREWARRRYKTEEFKEKARQRYLLEKRDPHLLKKRREYRRKNYLRRQAALRALKALGIRVESPPGYKCKSEGRYLAAFRALRQLGIEF